MYPSHMLMEIHNNLDRSPFFSLLLNFPTFFDLNAVAALRVWLVDLDPAACRSLLVCASRLPSSRPACWLAKASCSLIYVGWVKLGLYQSDSQVSNHTHSCIVALMRICASLDACSHMVIPVGLSMPSDACCSLTPYVLSAARHPRRNALTYVSTAL